MRYARSTPRKMRYVADMIRNKPVPEAQRILRYTSKRVSYFLSKLVNSAVANATTRDANLAPEALVVSEIKVGDGPAFKRWRSASMGRASQVKKRTSHVTLVLKTVEQPLKAAVTTPPATTAKPPKTTESKPAQPETKAGKKEKENKPK
ncbi:MAG: 50S ribosomal protein L22 [Planctomycetota bacterium]